MNYTLFIARRIFFNRTNASATKPIVHIAVAGIALGFCLMIITLAVVSGFKREIREKVIGFGSHIQISNFDQNNSYETQPVTKSPSFISDLNKVPGVKHIQVFATKAGIIKTKDNIEGIVLKGIDHDFDWSYFDDKIISGKKIVLSDTSTNNNILISRTTASRLKLKAGDPVIMYFIQNPPRARKFMVHGIYETGLEEFDKLYVLCDIRHIQKLNDWDKNQVGGFEVTVNDYRQLDEISKSIYQKTGFDLNARNIKELYPQIFDWLGLQDINAAIIIILMIAVAGINMISALLIIMLERINMIGTLKALGSESNSIRKIFLYVATFLIGRGLVIGNIIGLTLCFLQNKYHFIHLDQSSYYISYVPMNIDFTNILLLNLGTMLICTAVMILPTLIITRISPLKALRFS